MLDEALGRVRVAREAGAAILKAAGHAVELPEVAEAVEAHRWAWRPHEVRLILTAESHVFTSAEDVALTVVRERLPVEAQHAPTAFVRLIYCLGYGEPTLLSGVPTVPNRGTPQYWRRFGQLAGTNDRRVEARSPEERLRWKVDTLLRLREHGIWLLDASLHGIYSPGGSRPSASTVRALHRAWWQEYGRWVVDSCPGARLWAIGRGVDRALQPLDVPLAGWVYQPNAWAQPGMDLERGWREVLAIAGGSPLAPSLSPNPGQVELAPSTGEPPSPLGVAPRATETAGSEASAPAATYRRANLAFIAKWIEPLAWNDTFQVVTRDGVYQMTKAELYRDFPGVVRSASYRQHGEYSYSRAPRTAWRYRRAE